MPLYSLLPGLHVRPWASAYSSLGESVSLQITLLRLEETSLRSVLLSLYQRLDFRERQKNGVSVKGSKAYKIYIDIHMYRYILESFEAMCQLLWTSTREIVSIALPAERERRAKNVLLPQRTKIDMIVRF